MTHDGHAHISARLLAVGTSAMHDARNGLGRLESAIRPLWTPLALAGPAFTALSAPNDNLTLHRATSEAPAGRVMVVSAGASTDAAIFGDVLSRIALSRGIAGLITDGAVRDSDRIRSLGFPVFCAGQNLRSPKKSCWGPVQVVVTVGGLQIGPEDWIVADGDGVVIVPASEIQRALADAELIKQQEDELVRRAVAGESTIDQLTLRPPRS